MDLQDFAEFHVPALEADEIRFNIQIAIILAAVKEKPSGFSHWTLGAPGHCAIQLPGRAVLLGNLVRDECHELVRTVRSVNYPGVVGPGETARWFAEYATEAGVKFADPIPQRLHVLSGQPRYPKADGSARPVDATDAPLLFDWLSAFQREAVPHESAPERAHVEKAALSGRFLFWTSNDRPVSVAAISRELRHTAAIAPVYTPPEHRDRGYAGSATAAIADRAFADGKTTVCLYTDLRNPASNRCYEKIGFRPYCDAWHCIRMG